jgi:transcription elongation factor Elf1
MLNRLVGQTAQLAAALGLPTDFTCPICKSQLVLRLTPDPTEDNGVRGHFYCARCTGGR